MTSNSANETSLGADAAAEQAMRLPPIGFWSYDQATEAWGVKITRVEVKDIRPAADIVNAMGRQFPVEATRLIGTLGGIGALARDALGQSDAAAPRRDPFEGGQQ